MLMRANKKCSNKQIKRNLIFIMRSNNNLESNYVIETSYKVVHYNEIKISFILMMFLWCFLFYNRCLCFVKTAAYVLCTNSLSTGVTYRFSSFLKKTKIHCHLIKVFLECVNLVCKSEFTRNWFTACN